jgi:hypothetical protein
MPPKKLSPTAPEFVPEEQKKEEGLVGESLMNEINKGGKSRRRRSKKTKRTRTRRHR